MLWTIVSWLGRWNRQKIQRFILWVEISCAILTRLGRSIVYRVTSMARLTLQGNSYSVFLEWNCWSFWCRQTRYRLVAGSCGCSVIGCTYRNKIVMLAPFNCLFLDKLFRHGDTSLILTVMEGSDLVKISERSADQSFSSSTLAKKWPLLPVPKAAT